MKRLFLLFSLLWSTTLFAQAPNDSVVVDNIVENQIVEDEVEPQVEASTAEPIPESNIQTEEETAVADTAAVEEYEYDGVLNVIGDSYVRNHKAPIEETWHYKMAEQLNLKYNNYGRNGSCLAWDRSEEGFGPSVIQRAWDLDPEADYVLVIGGHNDAFKINESKHRLEDFRDSLFLLIANIRQQCPKAKIGFVTPWYVGRIGFEPTCKMIKQVCDKHHIPVLWNHSKSNVIRVRDPKFREQYFQDPDDHAHLNAKGHDLYLSTGLAWFKKYMMKEKN